MGQLQYQVGGTLARKAESYIARQADQDLYLALKRGEFCYVLNSRQMGKSSLMIRTRDRLIEEGYRCTTVDLTSIGSSNVTPLQWYKGIVKDLWRGFDLIDQFPVNDWWKEESDISLLQRLSYFISEVLLKQFPTEEIVIFIDEVDSTLNLPFTADDFFALIRFCYNQRATNSDFNRLRFAIFGVAAPADLIQERTRTPFNLGTAIEVKGFTAEEASPLAHGLEEVGGDYQALLKEILRWTHGQPFLTQKLCQIVMNTSCKAISDPLKIPPGNEAYWIEKLVQEQILKEWESRDEPEHLRTIRNRLLHNPEIVGRLLGIYQQVLANEQVKADDSQEQIELLLSGLLVKHNSLLSVKTPIYAQVFNAVWVEQQLSELRPYGTQFKSWLASNRLDESRLLRGQALKDAQAWSQGKRLDDEDYQFLAASVESDRQAAQKALEAERQIAEAEQAKRQLQQEQKNAKLQRQLLYAVSGALVVTLALGLTSFVQYRQAQHSERLARKSQVEALVSSSNGNYNSHQELDAMVDALQAHQAVNALPKSAKEISQQLKPQVDQVLRQSIYDAKQYNRVLEGGGSRLSISPNRQLIAAAIQGGIIQFLQFDGKKAGQIFTGGNVIVRGLAFSPDGQSILAAFVDRTVKIWSLDGTLLKTFSGFQAALEDAAFSPDGQYIAVAEPQQGVVILNLEGEVVTQLGDATRFAFSPDGKWFATDSPNKTVNLWKMPFPDAGSLTLTKEIVTTSVFNSNARSKPDSRLDSRPDSKSQAKTSPSSKRAWMNLAFSPDSQKLAIATGSNVQIWQPNGSKISQIATQSSPRSGIVFTPDSQKLAEVSDSKTVNIWNLDGTLFKELPGTPSIINHMMMLPDSQRLLTASHDGILRFWQWNNPFTERLTFPSAKGFLASVINPEGTVVMASTPGAGNNLHLWRRSAADASFDEFPIQTLAGHNANIRDVSVRADGQVFASGAEDGTIHLWNEQGQLLEEFDSQRLITDVEISPDGRQVAAGLSHGDIHLWYQDESGKFVSSPKILKGHEAGISRLAFSADGHYLASGSDDSTIQIWPVDDATLQQSTDQLPLQTFSGHTSTIHSVAFSPDGEMLVSSATDKTAQLWRRDGQVLHVLKGPEASLGQVAFSGDGQHVFSASKSGTIRIWSKDGELLRSLSNEDLQIHHISVSQGDPQVLVSGEGDHMVVWSAAEILKLDDLEYACSWLKDYSGVLANQENGEPAINHLEMCDS